EQVTARVVVLVPLHATRRAGVEPAADGAIPLLDRLADVALPRHVLRWQHDDPTLSERAHERLAKLRARGMTLVSLRCVDLRALALRRWRALHRAQVRVVDDQGAVAAGELGRDHAVDLAPVSERAPREPGLVALQVLVAVAPRLEDFVRLAVTLEAVAAPPVREPREPSRRAPCVHVLDALVE